jgi:hypothetical protein
MALIDVTYSEIRTVALNGEGREGKTYELILKSPRAQGRQHDLNLGPESWLLPYQTQRRVAGHGSLGPDDVMICCQSVLWPT